MSLLMSIKQPEITDRHHDIIAGTILATGNTDLYHGTAGGQCWSFGKWVMVKAGNMKISFEKDSGIIVNISGGGCPDIPYLNAEMVDKALTLAPHPNELGYTLCATMLERAYEEALVIFSGGSRS